MVQTYQNIISLEHIEKLLNYHYIDDSRTDSRPTVRSKHPRWNLDQWPQQPIANVLEQVLDKEYNVEEVIFTESTICFQIHTDSGYNNKPLYKAIIIPLQCDRGSTIFFDNHWYKDAAKFTRSADPFEHIKDKPEQFVTKDQRITDYSEISNYNDTPFDRQFYEQYLTHVPYENLHGLTVDSIVPWVPGDAIVFDRTQLHCASNEHDHKIGITLFTTRVK